MEKIAYTRELVLKKVKQIFPAEDSPFILEVLNFYGVEAYEYEKERVHIGMLKLSGGDVEKLLRCFDGAKQDPRDIMAAAEYPGAMKVWNTKELPPEEKQRIQDEDRKQFLEWLQSDGSKIASQNPS